MVDRPLIIEPARLLGFPQLDRGTHEETIYGRADHPDPAGRRAGRQYSGGVPQANLTEQTFYRWRNKYSGMEVSEVKRLRELEKENSELKKIVAEQMLDIRMLKDVNAKKW